MNFYVFDVEVPGTWLDGLDDGTAHAVQSLLYHVQSCLADAALSLSFFEAAMVTSASDLDSRRDSFERNAVRRRAKELELEAALPADLSPEERWSRCEELRHQAEIGARRDAWREGELPDTYRHRLPFLHARSFVTALEGIRKVFQAMQALPGAPLEVERIVRGIDEDIPAMKHVRDSIQHGEDRVQGLQRGKPIQLKPISNSLVHAPGGAVIYDALNGNMFGCTLADGEYGEIEVSSATARRIAGAVQQVVEAFSWRGPPDHVPR